MSDRHNKEEYAKRHFATKLLHFEGSFDEQTGASSTPVFQASTFHQSDLSQNPPYDYSRSGNPTRQALEDQIALLEGGTRGFAFASGMAAISTTFLLLSAGDHVIVTEDVYGGTYRLLTTVLNRLGMETTFVDMTDFEAVKAAYKENTKAVFIETPSNPTLKITNISQVASWAKEHNLLTILDNTFMTPYYQRPLELGVDIVVHSATKFLSGHSDVLAGLAVTADEELGRRLYQLQNGLGAVLSAHECWLLMRGIKTLQARMEHSERSARKLAEWLNEHPEVTKVYYPGLADHPGREVHEQQCSAYGAVVSFDVGSGERAKAMLGRVKIPLVAVSLGGVESILSYPAMMSHAAMPKEVRHERGITDGLVRYSVGLEHIEDLLADLDQALRG